MMDAPMILLLSVVGYFAVLYLTISATWAVFVFVMALKKRRDAGTLTKTQKIFGYPILFVVGFPLDVTLNLIISLAMLELPRWHKGEFLFTGRASRHYPKDTWRGKFSRWACDEFMEPFEAGHCT